MSLNHVVPAPTYVITNSDWPIYPNCIIEGGELLLTISQAFADYQHYLANIWRVEVFEDAKRMDWGSDDPNSGDDEGLQQERMEKLEKGITDGEINDG